MVLHTAVDPLCLVTASRELVSRIDPGIAMFQVATMQSRLDESLWVRRAYSWLLGVFAAVALVPAVAGIYDVISYTVSRRTQEIGIRMALGADRRRVLGQVLGQGIVLTGIGLAAGPCLAYLVTRLMSTLLFGVSPRDPWAYSLVAAGMLIVAFCANLIPARRAASVDPTVALRME